MLRHEVCLADAPVGPSLTARALGSERSRQTHATHTPRTLRDTRDRDAGTLRDAPERQASAAGGEVDEPLGNTLQHLLPSSSSGDVEHARERALRGRTPRRRYPTQLDTTQRTNATRRNDATRTRPQTRTTAGDERGGLGSPGRGRPAPELQRQGARRPRATHTLLHPALRYATHPFAVCSANEINITVTFRRPEGGIVPHRRYFA